MLAVWLNRLAILLSSAGVFVAGVLSLGTILKRPVPCGITQGCEAVAAHWTSHPLGIPVAYVGVVGYLLILVFSSLRATKGLGATTKLGTACFTMTAFGTFTSFILTIVSIVVIKQTCQWCLASAAIMTLLLFTTAGIAQLESAEGFVTSSVNKSLEAGFIGACLVLALGMTGYEGTKLGDATKSLKMDDHLKQVLDLPDTEAALTHLGAPTIGEAQAPVTVIEFADMACNVCRQEMPKVIDLLNKSNGRIRYIFRNFPLKDKHPMSVPAAFVGAIAQEKGKFFPFIEKLMDPTAPELQSKDQIYAVAESLGITTEEIKKRIELDDDPALRAVLNDMSMANALGVQFTPTFIIFAKGIKPIAITGSTLEDTLKGPAYQKLLKPDAAS